jgi:hypothetical protein
MSLLVISLFKTSLKLSKASSIMDAGAGPYLATLAAVNWEDSFLEPGLFQWHIYVLRLPNL